MTIEVTQEDSDCMNAVLIVIAASQTGDLRSASHDDVADAIAVEIARHRQAAYEQGVLDGVMQAVREMRK